MMRNDSGHEPEARELIRRPPGQLPPPPEAGYGYSAAAYDYAEEPEGEGLLEYWRILMRRKGTVILAMFLGGILAALITLPQTKIYQATTTIEIQNLNPDFMEMDKVSPVEQSASRTGGDIETYIEILKSNTLVRRALGKLGWTPPEKATETDTSRLSAWRRALKLGGGGAEREPRLQALDYAADNLTVRSRGQTRIVEVSVDSPEPTVAANLANTITDEFVTLNLEARWTSTQRTSEWLSGQLEEMKIKLERSEEELRRYAQRAGLHFTGEQRNVAEERLAQLQQELSAAQADRRSKQSRYELAASSPAEVLPDILDDGTLRSYQERLTELRREEAELTTTFTAEHPKVRRVAAQIETVEDAFAKARDAILGRIETQYEEALRREELIEEQYARQARLVSDQAQKAIQYNILKKDVDSYRQQYETILDRVKEASVAGALSASNVRVVDPAEAPASPYKPRLAMNGLLGLMLGGFLGVVFVIVRERADRSLQDPGDSTMFLEIPELGVIPDANAQRPLRYLPYVRKKKKQLPAGDAVGSQEAGEAESAEAETVGAGTKSKRRRSGRGRRQAREAWPTVSVENGENGSGAGDPAEERLELVTWFQAGSAISESFRTTLTSILFSGKNGDRPRVIVLTSSQPAEGKTTVASNLAIALAELSRNVLLIDGDLRKPRLHDVFSVGRDEGLAEYLSSSGPVEEELATSVRATKVPGLYLMPAGKDSGDFTNMLYSARMSALLEYCESHYDMVLIDTPPMLNMPDARVLGRMSDAVILVIKSGRTTRDTALAAKERLRQDGTRVLGTVLNQWNPKKTSGGYGYRYYYEKYYRGYYKSYE